MSGEAWDGLGDAGRGLNVAAEALCAALLVLASPKMQGFSMVALAGWVAFAMPRSLWAGPLGFGAGMCAGWLLELAGVGSSGSWAFSIGMAAASLASLTALRMAPKKPRGRWARIGPWMKPLGLAAALAWASTLSFC